MLHLRHMRRRLQAWRLAVGSEQRPVIRLGGPCRPLPAVIRMSNLFAHHSDGSIVRCNNILLLSRSSDNGLG